MIKIEIASYPKSGNTWVLELIYQFLLDIGADGAVKAKGIHRDVALIKEDIARNRGVVIADQIEPVYFYKSHKTDNSAVNPDKIIYIYRHPLDVLLSTINWYFINSEDYPEEFSIERLDELFLNGQPKSCEEIDADGEMDYYFDKFVRDHGMDFYRGFLFEDSDYFVHTTTAINNPKVFPIKYEALFEDPSSLVIRALGFALEADFSTASINIKEVNKRTKESGEKFYWKSKSGTRHDFFTPAQISKFEGQFEHELRQIGYLG